MGEDLRLELTPELASAAVARRAVMAAAQDWGFASLAGDVGLVTSELVTNAVLHAGTDVGLQLSHRDGIVRLSVADGDPRFPTLRDDADTGLTGRGLRVVDGLTRAWGVAPAPAGKEVWCEFGDRAAEPPALAAPPVVPAPAPATITVRLEGVPIAMLQELKEHLDNLVRESTLAARGAVETGRDAPERIGRLVAGLRTRFSAGLRTMEEQARAALARGERHCTIAVPLAADPADAAEGGRRYLGLMEEADELSRAGRLLTPESRPQLKVFRHWYVGEILRQLADPTVPPRPFDEYLLDTVGEALEISVHAAREARITRLSAALWGAASSADVADVVAEAGRLAIGATAAAVAVLGDDRRLAAAAESGPPVPVDEAAAEQVARTGEPVWVPELGGDGPFSSACTVALQGEDGPIGLVTFAFDRPHLFPPDERDFILLVARRAADALHRAQELEGERRLRAVMSNARDRGEFLAEVTEVLSSTLDVAATVHGLGRLLVPRLADGCAVWLTDGRRLGSVAVSGDPLTLDDAVVDDVFTSGRTAVVPDRDGGEIAVLPMRARGHPLGVVAVARTSRRWPLRPALTALLEETVSRGAIAIDNARLYEERSEVARTLQRSLLPPREPEVPGLDVAARYVPGATGLEVGGDFYDVFPTGTGRYAVVIGDVCGSGAEAAAVTSLARHTVRALAMAAGRPRRVLSMLNDALLAADIGDRFCTVLFGTLRLRPGLTSLIFSSGGHPEPVVVRASGETELVDVDGTILGTLPDPHLRDGRVELAPGDVLVLYTDGVTEARAKGTAPFGPDRLVALVRAHRSETAAAIAAAVVDAVVDHCGGTVNDDVAVLVIRQPENDG